MIVEFPGTLFEDPFGRLYVDSCKTTQEHLGRAIGPDEERPPSCRLYVDDVFRPLLGKTGKYYFMAVCYEDSEAAQKATQLRNAYLLHIAEVAKDE